MDVPLSHRDVYLLAQLSAAPAHSPAQLADLMSLIRLRPSGPDDPDALLIEGAYVLLVLVRSSETDACPFLQPSGACGIYSHRPRACRSFPFALNRLGLLQIDAEAQPIYDSRCDKLPVSKVIRQDGHDQLRRGGDEFDFYRKLVSRWNHKSRHPSGDRSLAVCLPFLLTARELEIEHASLSGDRLLQ